MNARGKYDCEGHGFFPPDMREAMNEGKNSENEKKEVHRENTGFMPPDIAEDTTNYYAKTSGLFQSPDNLLTRREKMPLTQKEISEEKSKKETNSCCRCVLM